MKISDNLQKIAARPFDAASFFAKKTVTTWCEPTLQSVWSGPLEDCGQQTHTSLLASIYNGKKANKALTILSKTFILMLFLLSTVFLVKHRHKNGWQLVFIFLIGGILFHLLWETKSQYVYQYVIMLIPFASYASYKGELK